MRLAVTGLVAPAAATETGVSLSEESVVRLVDAAAPVEVPTAAPTIIDEESVTVVAPSTDMSVTVPESAEQSIVLELGSRRDLVDVPAIDISLPSEVDVEDGALTDSGAVVYTGTGTGVDVVVQPLEDGSVRINSVINHPEAPHDFTYSLGLPDTASLELMEDGSIQIVDGDQWLGGIAAPWAVDVAGASVATRYKVDGQTFTQVVSPSEQTQYPVVADPWLGIALVSKAVWTGYLSSYGGYTLKVYPSWWGRYGVYPTLGVGTYVWMRSAFWNEVKSKASGTREETSSMRDQLYCHVDVVRLYQPNKESWNLDTWRPTVSYSTMLARQCNP